MCVRSTAKFVQASPFAEVGHLLAQSALPQPPATKHRDKMLARTGSSYITECSTLNRLNDNSGMRSAMNQPQWQQTRHGNIPGSSRLVKARQGSSWKYSRLVTARQSSSRLVKASKHASTEPPWGGIPKEPCSVESELHGPPVPLHKSI